MCPVISSAFSPTPTLYSTIKSRGKETQPACWVLTRSHCTPEILKAAHLTPTRSEVSQLAQEHTAGRWVSSVCLSWRHLQQARADSSILCLSPWTFASGTAWVVP